MVRQTIGYARYEGQSAVNIFNEIYDNLRLLNNFFMPSSKLLSKTRDGSKISKMHDKALTPYHRLLASKDLSESEKYALNETFPEAKYQRCTVHFYRNVFSVVPRTKMKLVAAMLKAIHAQEDLKSAKEKAKLVAEKLREMKLREAVEKIEKGVHETLAYMHFPREHWSKIRSNNMIERVNREIRRRTRVVGTFPDGNSALMLVCARLRYVEGSAWGEKRYMSMKHLEHIEDELEITAG